MNKKSIEDNYSIELDAYINGIEEKNKSKSEEYSGLLELGKTLADEDFSKGSNKEVVFNKVLKNINERKGDNIVKKSNKIKHSRRAVAAAAAVCIISISLTQTSFAKELAEKIIKVVSLGHTSIMQIESSEIEKMPVPDEFKGKIFDKNGKPIEVVTKGNADNMYTANGEKIVSFSDGKIITEAEAGKIDKEQKVLIKDTNELSKYTCFKVILPSYLPKDYKFDRAEITKDKNGLKSESRPYIDIYFTNEKTGKFIYMQQRIADESMNSVSSANKVEQVKINGVDAVISDNRYIDWEYNNVIYSLSVRGEIKKIELMKIAESIK